MEVKAVAPTVWLPTLMMATLPQAMSLPPLPVPQTALGAASAAHAISAPSMGYSGFPTAPLQVMSAGPFAAPWLSQLPPMQAASAVPASVQGGTAMPQTLSVPSVAVPQTAPVGVSAAALSAPSMGYRELPMTPLQAMSEAPFSAPWLNEFLAMPAGSAVPAILQGGT